MKKNLAIVAALAAGFVMVSCKSSESAYKKAYEKAQAAQNTEQQYTQQYTQQQTQPIQVTPVQPVQQTQPVQQYTQQQTQPVQDYSNVSVRNEAVTLVDGVGLKDFSVVVGSMSMLSNAQGLKATLMNKGYNALIVQANVNGQPFYRVIATTHNTKAEAAQSRVRLTQEYPDAWLLYKK